MEKESVKYTVAELLDALDDLEDGVAYVREIIHAIIFNDGAIVEEEEDLPDDGDDSEHEPEKEEKVVEPTKE